MIMLQKERQSIEEVEVNVDVVSSIVNSREEAESHLLAKEHE